MFGALKKIRYYKLYRPELARKMIWDAMGFIPHQPEPEISLHNTMQWLQKTFEATPDDGSSAYYMLGHGWKSSYPETTGYIISTLLDYHKFSGEQSWRDLALRAADWLLSIQAEEGGWQGLQIGEKCGLRVFNTGMILDGLMSVYRETRDEKYLRAGLRGANWMLEQRNAEYIFSNNNVSGGATLDTLVCAGALMVYQHTDSENQKLYFNEVRKSLDAYLAFQQENGWFARCNFDFNDLALTHIIGYTLDGLVISSEILGEEKYYLAAKKTADSLLNVIDELGTIPAYLSSTWTPFKDMGRKYSVCLTGCSQIAIVFQKIYRKENDIRFLHAAEKLNNFVASVGNFNFSSPDLRYGIPGSFPINGRYQPFQFVNWAAKYHAESILRTFDACLPKAKLSATT